MSKTDTQADVKDVDMKETPAEGVAEGSAEVVAEAIPDVPKEKELDAPDDKAKRIASKDVVINAADTTLNVLPTMGGKCLMALTDGGFQHLLAGARAAIGAKAGRYMFEIKILEALSPAGQGQQPRQVIRVGLSTAKSSLFLGDGEDNVCFDSEGYYAHNGSWKKVMPKATRGQTLALLLNLDSKSPNANTVSLFCDGVRVSDPQALPEHLVGKALFPTITYRNVTLQVNFEKPLAPLPFTCRALADASAADCECAAIQPKKVGEKAEVFFPVGLPEQGYFDFVDQFLAKHPQCTELSNRMLATWAAKSGLGKSGASQSGTNDRPDMKTGVPAMDDLSIRKILQAVAPTTRRNFVVADLKGNLVGNERKQAVLDFSAADFKKTALVLLGDPAPEYKEKVKANLLAEKRAKAEEERRKKKQQAERARLMEAKKKALLAARAKQTKAEGKKEGEEDAEEKKEEKEDKAEQKEEQEEPIELTEEEKKIVHRKRNLPDISERVLSKAFSSFSLPVKEDGFDSVSFVWQDEQGSAKLLKAYVVEKKLTQKAEDLQPGEWFMSEWAKWQEALQGWRKAQAEFKDPFKRKALLAKRKEQAEKEAAEKGDGEKNDATSMDIDASCIEPADVKDVTDLGNGEPLFAYFAYEDWSLLSSRYEFHLLLHSFKQDLNDEDRPSFGESHLSFYYNRYFKKVFNLKAYGVEKFADFAEFIKDSCEIDGANNGFLKAVLPKDAPIDGFVRLTEEHRRERQMLVDAGDETAKLKFTRPAPPAPAKQEKGGKGGHQQSGQGGGSSKRQYQPSPSAYQGSSKQPRYSGQGSYGGYGGR